MKDGVFVKVNFFIPKYMTTFKCIGPNCTDTCCAGWDINIDESTFNKYENSTNELKRLVEGKYIKNNVSYDPFNYGFMVITEEKKCPFLNSSLLCNIHGECGEDNLSITCKNYPRIFNIIDDVYEKSGIPSCEEICQLAFKNKDKMEFIELEEEIDEEAIEIRRVIDTEAFEGSSSLIQYFWDIRIASINIMQNRDFSIEERLGLLKSFYSNIQALKEKVDFDEIEDLLEKINLNQLNTSILSNQKIDSYLLTSSEYLFTIVNDDLINRVIGNRIKTFLRNLNINIAKSSISPEVTANDINKHDRELAKYSYIFENYLVNQIFKDIIPFNKGENLIESINSLINLYLLIKAYLILDSKYSGMAISENQIIRVIQALSKDTEHNKVFKNLIN